MIIRDVFRSVTDLITNLSFLINLVYIPNNANPASGAIKAANGLIPAASAAIPIVLS